MFQKIGLWFFLCWVLGACAGGAVMFAPPAPPLDTSPLLYTHPSGAFSLLVPRPWTVYTQNWTNLATAAFSQPNNATPLLRVSLVDVGRKLDAAAFNALLDDYQTRVRPCAYQNRAAMGDGSWRLTAACSDIQGTAQVNTFIQQQGTRLSVVEVALPSEAAAQRELQGVINSLQLQAEAALTVTELDTLLLAAAHDLAAQHVALWSTPTGVFFITGEVVNHSAAWVSPVVVRAVLETADGRGVAEARDVTMGYGIPPGGFAPFSLRFGQGQPPQTTTFALYLGEGGSSAPSGRIVTAPELTWTEESQIGADGRLAVDGTVTNASLSAVQAVQAIVTAFDAENRVIAAAFGIVTPQLAGGDSTHFSLLLPELGALPQRYTVQLQALVLQ